MKATLQDLLESGLYFGHPGKQFDPRMKPYVFAKRQGIFIIDLLKTRDCLKKACDFLQESARQGKEFIFVGTKNQVQEIIREQSREIGFHFMCNRWLGGTLTNFTTIRARINRMNELVEKEEQGAFDTNLSKKEASVARKEKERLLKNLEGLKDISRIPDVMIVFDVHKEENAVREARACGLSIVGVVDTNANPEMVHFPVPANDDGRKGLQLIISEFCEAIRTGTEERDQQLKKAQEEKRQRESEEKKKLEEEKKAEEARAKADKERAGEKEAGAEGEKPAPRKTAPETPVKAGATEEKAPGAKEADESRQAEAGEEKAEKGKKQAVKPKPRPRIRSKYRHTATAKSATTAAKKSAGSDSSVKSEKKADGTTGKKKKTTREESADEPGKE